MNILEEIISHKREQLKRLEVAVPPAPHEASASRSMRQNILQSEGLAVIAEYKRRSPSAGLLGSRMAIEQVVSGYERAGAVGISVLTDGHYFGGSLADLRTARTSCRLPILRKDFIVDVAQVDESAEAGADAILLIARVLSEKDLAACRVRAAELGLEVRLEVHAESELAAALAVSPEIIGINNRNLDTLQVDLSTSFRLISLFGSHTCVISESGIRSIQTLKQLQDAGYKGFLVGEQLLRRGEPEEALRELLSGTAV